MADVAFCLSAQINWSLENDLCGNAVFLSERLYALQDSEENLLQLAKSYMRSNQAIRAYFLLASEIRQMTGFFWFVFYCMILVDDPVFFFSFQR